MHFVKCKMLAPEAEGQCKETSLWSQGELDLEPLAINTMLGDFVNFSSLGFLMCKMAMALPTLQGCHEVSLDEVSETSSRELVRCRPGPRTTSRRFLTGR